MKKLVQSWRWYGPNDPVSLNDIKQAGATGVVSALHQIPHGEVWTKQAILERKEMIENAGLEWNVVESLPVHEAIKTRSNMCDSYLEKYRKSLKNLASCGLNTICYNFMPVLDWTRTQLDMKLDSGARSLYFDWVNLAVFDKYVLQRNEAQNDYPMNIWEKVDKRYKSMSAKKVDKLTEIILMGVPTEKGVSLSDLRSSIDIYKELGRDGLRDNLSYFLSSIASICEEENINLTIHPDDPPFDILGLPRIARSKEDLLYILQAVDKPFNGICFCTGSLGAGSHNNLAEILLAVKERVNFVHLRNVSKDLMGNFYESEHLNGDVNMAELMGILVDMNQNRSNAIPFRPDHGYQMLDDLTKETNPGYSAIGRLKGLAELRGLELGIIYGKT
ncbi:mannonate dehydratase [Echinicola salinicaeni]|uniref:mannonate dehydratase n=1 Tax=Echinicola salinicaeni TaxID=2762757 RepID=UPI0016489DE2|nr:mannonate dehydratase [Echinicola salinicaeni]